jgi:hypothetical protein
MGMFGLKYIPQSIQDEQGAVSSARVQSYIAAFGFFLFGALAVLFALFGNQMGTTACVTLAGVAFGKSAADMMAAQKKSATALAASASASVQLNSIPTPQSPIPPTPSPHPSYPPQASKAQEKATEHTKRVLAIMRLSFVDKTPTVSEGEKKEQTWSLRPSRHILIRNQEGIALDQVDIHPQSEKIK